MSFQDSAGAPDTPELFRQPDDLGKIQASDLNTSLVEQTYTHAEGAFMGGVRGLYHIFEHGQASGIQPPAEFGGLSPDVAAELERRQPTPELSIADAKARVKQEGLEGRITLPADRTTIRKPVLDLMLDDAQEDAAREAAISRGPQGFWPSALGFLTEVGVGIFDPVNAAAFSVPVIGETRYGAMLARAGESYLRRGALATAKGAAQGVVGGAAMAPLDWWGHTLDGQDYTMADALRSIALGAGMGAVAHGIGSAIGDVRARMAGRPLPGSPEDLAERALRGDEQAAEILAKIKPPPAAASAATPTVDLGEVPGMAGPPHPAETLADLPESARGDVTRAAVADVINGQPVRAAEMLETAAQQDPRLTESVMGPPRIETGLPHVDAILRDPETAAAIANPKVNREQDVPYTAGPDNEGNGLNIDRNFPTSFTVEQNGDVRATKPGDVAAGLRTFDPAEPLAAHEFPERAAMKKLMAGRDQPVPDGYIRLWRGETDIPSDHKTPEWAKEAPEYKAMLEATGRWFVRDRETAEYYNRTFGDKSGRVSYVDVPAADVENYLSANQPEAKRFSAAGRETEEHFVPKDIAAKRILSTGMDQATAYKVAHTDVAEVAEGQWYKDHDIDKAKAEAAYQPYINQIEHEKLLKGDGDVPANLFKKPYPKDNVNVARGEHAPVDKPTAEESARGREILAPTERAPVDSAAATEESQRQTIAQRIRADLIAAGRSDEEATHLANIEAANIVTTARQFEGRAGTALDVYEREHAGFRQMEAPTAEAGQERFQRAAAPPFYSAVERAVTSAKQDKASPEQWLGMLRNMPGVKAEELQWLGLEDWLKQQKGPVTKAQVADFVRANQIEVREVEKREPDQAKLAAAGQAVSETHEAYLAAAPGTSEAEAAFRRYRQAVRNQQEAIREAGNSVAAEQSLQAVQETSEAYLATAPGTPEAEAARRRYNAAMEARNSILDAAFLARPKFTEYTLTGGENKREMLLTLPERGGPGKENYRVPLAHAYGDEASDVNRIAHIFMDDRVIDGKRTLLLKEVQSDPAEELRKVEKRIAAGTAGPSVAALSPILRRLPFIGSTDTWTSLVMKRMIRYAAENGYDKLAWVPGEERAAAYDLSKQIRSVHLDETIKGGDGGYLTAYDHQGQEVLGQHVTSAELPDIIGKDAADKLLAREPEIKPRTRQGARNTEGLGKRTIEGLDLKVGGEGMKGFYDQILPATVTKLTKKFGGRVGRSELGAPEAETHSVHTLDITPQLRTAAVEHGFPLFQEGRAGEPLGRITFADGQRFIDFFKNADASTGLHELGHMWLERFMRYSAREDAPESMRTDRATILRELGADHPDNITDEQHEQFARWVEQYVRTGDAPSSRLAGAFAKFREWLLAIYRTMQRLGSPISDDMRGVMDHMLATPEETADYRALARRDRASERMVAQATGEAPPHLLWYQGIPAEGVGKPQRSEYWTTNRDLAYDYAGKGGFIHVARDGDLPSVMREKAQGGKTDSVFMGERRQVPTVATLPRDAAAAEFEALAKAQEPKAVSELPATAAPETIGSPAHRIKGKVYTASNHLLALEAAAKDLGVDTFNLFDIHGSLDALNAGDGFVTSSGRFVTREEARDIAQSSGQGKATADVGIKKEDLIPSDQFRAAYPDGDRAAEVPARSWEDLANRPDPDPDLTEASRAADRAPEPASVDSAKAPSAAEKMAAEVEKSWRDMEAGYSEEERALVNNALTKLDDDNAGRLQMIKDAAACLMAAGA